MAQKSSKYLTGVCESKLLGRDKDNSESFIRRCEIDYNKEKLESGEFIRERKRPKCSSKNAILARMNRLKKKSFLESLQNDVTRLSDENTKLKQALEGQSSLVCSLRKEANYLKGVLANNKEISMLLRSIQNTRLPLTSSLRKHFESNQISSTADHNYVQTRSDSKIGSSSSENSATFIVADDNDEIPIIDDVALSLSMSDDNTLDLPLLSPSDRNLYDTEFSGCYSVQPTTFDSSLAGSGSGEDELFPDVGICLHVAKKRVSLEFCSTCSNNAFSTWNDFDTIN